MSDIELLQVDHLDWPNSVISAAIATPPGSPTLGDRYIVASSPTGAWSGHATHVARWNGSAWLFQTPTAGRLAYNEATSGHLKFDGSAWVSFTTSATLQNAYDAGATIALSATDLVASDTGVEVLRLGSTTKLAAPTQPTANTQGYALTITGSTGGAAAVSGTPGDGGTVTIAAGTMGSETSSPGSAVGGVAGNHLILQGGSGGNVSGAKSGSVFIDGGQLGSGAAGGTPVPGDVKIGTNANQTHVVRMGQSTSGTPVEVKGPIWTPLTTLTDATTVTVTIAKGNAFKVVLGGNRTLDFSFPTSYSNSSLDITGHSGRLVVQQDATGGRTLSFATKVKTSGDVTLNSAANAYTVFSFDVESLSIVHLRKVEGASSGVSLTSNAPANVTAAAAAVGTGTAAARDDHKHNIATAAPSTLVVGGSNTAGSSTSLALADHLHALPAFGTSSGTFMQGNQAAGGDASGTLNSLTVTQARGLVSATTTVSVSAATAPTSGQVLTATSGTAATWQAPSGGTPSGAAGGDLGGTYPNPTVTQARGLVSATTTVAVSSATAPTSGQVLTATSSTAATWQTPSSSTTANALASATTTINVSSATAPATGAVLTATDSTHATWQTPTGGAASDLATTGANVNVSAAAPPSAGKVLTATDATHATWQSPATASFSVSTDIAPLHWWLASQTSQSSGVVDSINDQGSSAKNFTQTGTNRCATATDGNGKTYLAFDGSTSFYQAGVAADWKFLNDGSEWTISIVYNRNAAITGFEVLLDTTNETSASTGMAIVIAFSSSTIQGPYCYVSTGGGSGTQAIYTGNTILDTSLSVLVIRNWGKKSNNFLTGGITPTAYQAMTMRRRGALISDNTTQGSYTNANPSFALTLGRRASTSGEYTASRFYEIIVDNKRWSDRQTLGYEDYARQTYVIPGM